MRQGDLLRRLATLGLDPRPIRSGSEQRTGSPTQVRNRTCPCARLATSSGPLLPHSRGAAYSLTASKATKGVLPATEPRRLVSWSGGALAAVFPHRVHGGEGAAAPACPLRSWTQKCHLTVREHMSVHQTGAGLPVLASRTHGRRARVKAERSEPRSGARRASAEAALTHAHAPMAGKGQDEEARSGSGTSGVDIGLPFQFLVPRGPDRLAAPVWQPVTPARPGPASAPWRRRSVVPRPRAGRP